MKTTKEKIAVMQAFEDGAEIERRGKCMEKLFHTYGTGTIYVNAIDWFDADGKVKPWEHKDG